MVGVTVKDEPDVSNNVYVPLDWEYDLIMKRPVWTAYKGLVTPLIVN